MSNLKLKSVALIAVALSAANVAQIAAGALKVSIGDRSVLGVIPQGTTGYLITGLDAVWTADHDGKITGCLSDPNDPAIGQNLTSVQTVEQEAQPFDLDKIKAGTHVAYTRSGNRCEAIIDAGEKAPEFGRVVALVQQPRGYLLPVTVSIVGKRQSDKDHTQDLFIVEV